MLLPYSKHFANVKGGYLSLTFYNRTILEKMLGTVCALLFLRIKIMFISIIKNIHPKYVSESR